MTAVDKILKPVNYLTHCVFTKSDFTFWTGNKAQKMIFRLKNRIWVSNK